MAFTSVSASLAARGGSVLSADNGGAPEKHIVVETLREAAPLLGLAASVLATLETLLSCLPPKRNHHTVFASNATLTFRRNGISERTIRRHASTLAEAGLLARHDSPNRKRYSRSSAEAGKTLRFGFDLTPLFERITEIAALAAEARARKDHEAYLRAQIRAGAQTLPEEAAITLLKTLRRKLSLTELTALAEALPRLNAECETPELTATNGQIVRQYQNSKKENIDKTNLQHSAQPLSIPELLDICTEAKQFALSAIETPEDVIQHARQLAPMIGIDRATYTAGEMRLGLLNTALTIWGLIQRQSKIQRLGAYFRSVTSGAKSEGFDAVRFVRMSALA